MMNGVDACLTIRIALPKAISAIECEISNINDVIHWYKDRGEALTCDYINSLERRASQLYEERERIEILMREIDGQGAFSAQFMTRHNV